MTRSAGEVNFSQPVADDDGIASGAPRLAVARTSELTAKTDETRYLMSRLTGSFSFWALVVFAALVALQWSPYTGIFLMVIAAPLWCGLIAHAFLLGLAAEAMLGRFPRFLLVVPLAAYGAYYASYLKEAREIDAKTAQIRAANPSLVLQYDPARYSLVLPKLRAQLVASRYDVPVTYEVAPNFRPEGFASHRLLDSQQCEDARAAQARLREHGFHVAAYGAVMPVQEQDGFSIRSNFGGVCLLTFPEVPPLPQIVVTRQGDEAVWRREPSVLEQLISFHLDGKVFATYKTASVWRLSPLPLFLIGCHLNSGNPSWDCFANFNRSLEVIDTTPEHVDKARGDSPESIVLGLRKYSSDDYSHFKGDGRWSALIERIDSYPREQADFEIRHKADLFNQFADFVRNSSAEAAGPGASIVYNGDKFPPNDMQAAVLAKPDQLIPLRDAMAARFAQFAHARISIYDHWFTLIQTILVALPRDAYASMPDEEVAMLLDALKSYGGPRYFGSLYIRMADAGPRTLAFYQGDLAKSQGIAGGNFLAPELAICRLGQADEATRVILRQQFINSSESDKFDSSVQQNSAAFVTLLRLGDATVAGGVPPSFQREDVIRWYEAVRQGRGQTDVGPNNCNGWSKQKAYFSPALRPALVYRDNAWIEADAK